MIIYGADEFICDWVSEGLAGKKGLFQNAKGLGVVEKEKLCAGVVYNNYQTDKDDNPLYVEMTIFSIDKIWCNRHNLGRLFLYPFSQLQLRSVRATCSAHDEGVKMFLTRLGFKEEGYHRQAYLDGSDAVSFGMLKEECKWIGGKNG